MLETEPLKAMHQIVCRKVAETMNEAQYSNAQMVAKLTILERPNLLAILEWKYNWMTPEGKAIFAQRIERLLSKLGFTAALAKATDVREQSGRELNEWGHAKFHSKYSSIWQMLERGNLTAAKTTAQQLWQQCLEAGKDAYPEATYDTALVLHILGRVLTITGEADAALRELSEAKRMFEDLASSGDSDAERLIAVTIDDMGKCLSLLGRLDLAATTFAEAIERAQVSGDQRQVAISKANLATVYSDLGDCTKALEIYSQSRVIFEHLGEQENVATTLHQIGKLYMKIGQLDPSEQALRQALAIHVQQYNPANEVLTLFELGNLNLVMRRFDDAATIYRQVADLCAQLQDHLLECKARTNMATALICLQRYNEADTELRRAIKDNERFGYAAEPWKAWAMLYEVELTIGNTATALAARERALHSFLAYRRDGGENHNPTGRLSALVYQAIQRGAVADAEQTLAHWANVDLPADLKAFSDIKVFIASLQAILRGDRNPALADNPALGYEGAVELRLLQETLGAT